MLPYIMQYNEIKRSEAPARWFDRRAGEPRGNSHTQRLGEAVWQKHHTHCVTGCLNILRSSSYSILCVTKQKIKNKKNHCLHGQIWWISVRWGSVQICRRLLTVSASLLTDMVHTEPQKICAERDGFSQKQILIHPGHSYSKLDFFEQLDLLRFFSECYINAHPWNVDWEMCNFWFTIVLMVNQNLCHNKTVRTNRKCELWKMLKSTKADDIQNKCTHWRSAGVY